MHAGDTASLPARCAHLLIRRVTARYVLDWLAAGWADFRRAPAPLSVATIVLLILAVLGTRAAGWLPVLLLPIYLGTVAAYSRMAAAGQVFLAGSGAWRNARLWGLAIAIVLLGAVLNGVLAAGAIFTLQALLHMPTEVYLVAQAFLILVRLLGLLVLAACWLAPALIVNRDAGVLQALRLSMTGSFRNASAFLVMAPVAYGLLSLAALPLGLGLVVALPVLAGAAVRAADDIVGEAH